MQYLKEEVRERIIASALVEFKTKGYLGASMKRIAAASAITPGNIYRYFDKKETLFEAVVSPANTMMLDLVHADVYKDNGTDNKPLDIEAIMERVMSVCEKYSSELVVLFFSAKGTKYENIRSDLIRLIEDRLLENLFAGKEDLAFIIASSFIEGVLVILQRYENDVTEIRELIAKLIVLFFADVERRF